MTKVYDKWQDYPMTDWRWKNFSPQELACKGTGSLMLNPDAMDRLQALRDELSRPLIITSAYRSPSHNRNVGGATNSFHMRGMAFDVRQDNHDPAAFIRAARKVGFTGIGTYPRSGFVHVDNRGAPATWGAAFPKSASGLAAQPAREPEKLTENTNAQVAGGIGVASAAVGVGNQVTQDGGLLDRLQEPATFVILIALVAGYLFWREWRGRR